MTQKRKIDLTQKIVRELLDYDPVSGVLTWHQSVGDGRGDDCDRGVGWNKGKEN